MATVTYTWNEVAAPRLVNETPATIFTNIFDIFSIAALSGGQYFVTWSDGLDSSLLTGRVIDSDGTLLGNDFLVNSTATGQNETSIAQLVNGNVLVTFTRPGVPGPIVENLIQASLFAADGTPIALNFGLVTTQFTNNQRPDIAALSDGGFVVSWKLSGNLAAQIFNADGTPRSAQLVLSAPAVQGKPSVVGLADGGFVVAFEQPGSVVYFQRYNADGAQQGSDVLIDGTDAFVRDVQVVALKDGGFAVAYREDDGGGASTDIALQIFNADGTARTDHLRPNLHTAADQADPTLTVLANGYIVVGWRDGGTLVYQAYTPQGAAVATNFAATNDIIEGEIAGLTGGLVASLDSHFVQSSSTYTITTSIHELTRTITADFANEVLRGDSLNDTIIAVSGDNVLIGGGGNDTLIGGFGVDRAVYSGARTQYQATLLGNGDIRLVDLRAGSPDGTDTIRNVDDFAFADGTFTAAQLFGPTTTTTPHIFGTPGHDTFAALPGNERIDALGGIDTIIFDFRLTEATISFSGNQVIVDGPSGSHTVLTGFEIYKFTDGTVNNNDGDALVDDLFYYSRNHDVWNANLDADQHYHASGWRVGLDPNAFFSSSLYLSANPDVKAAGLDPVVHFDQFGWKESRVPSLTFDARAYLAANPDVAAAHVDPLRHFLQFGAQEGRQPFAPIAANGFDYSYYLANNPDVAAAHVDPFVHFETIGWKEGRDPNALFDTSGYLAAYADVRKAGINPLDHYHTLGWHEGRDPSPAFDTTDYLAAYPDVRAAHIDPLVHFLVSGINENRSPFADGMWG